MRASKISWLISFLSLFAIFLFPKFIDGMNGGFALSFISIVICLTAFISGFIFLRLEKQKDSILKKENILIHWTYTSTEWKRFIEKDLESDKSIKIMLFWIITAWALLFAILFPLFDKENGIIVSYIMFGLILIIGITAYLSIKIAYNKNLNTKNHEVYINKNAVLIGENFHCWKGFGLKLDSVQIDNKKNLLIFSYSSISRTGKNYYEARVLIPQDKKQEAEELLKTFTIE